MSNASYMKNNEIIQMLLDDGESTAIPHQIKENPRTLALRHGNCVEKKLKSNSDHKRSLSDTKKDAFQTEKDVDIFNKLMDNATEKGSSISERLPNDFNFNKEFNFSGECFETLIDSILLCQTNYSFMVGIFFKYANFLRCHNILRLKDFIEKKYFSTVINNPRFRLTPFLSFFIIAISLLFGYVCGLIISWHVGLAVGFTILFVLFIGITLILIGTYCQEWRMALQAGVVVGNVIQACKLWLKIFFLNPSQGNEFNSNELRFIYTHLVLSNYSNNFHVIAKFIENIWSSIEKNYNNFFIRFQKASLNQDYGDRKFKKICCLPTFVYFIITLICSLSLGTILRVHQFDLPSFFTKQSTMLVVFIFLAVVLFFCIIILLFLFVKIIYYVIHSPTHNLKGFLKSYDIYGEASTQSFLMNEFNSVLHFISQLDNYEKHHRSFVITFVDATGATDLKVLVDFCSFCQILLKNRNEISMCFLILIDNQLYTMAKTSDEIINFIKFSKLLSLCLHFNDSNTISVFNPSNNKIPLKSEDGQLTLSNKVSNFDNIQYVGVNSSCDRYKSDFIIQKLYKNPVEKNHELQEDLAIQSISDYLIMKSKLTDFNIPYVKELVITSTYSYKLSQVQNVSTDLFKLIDLVTFFYHWPFLYSWMTLFIENNYYVLKKTLSLRKLYDSIMRNMLQSMIEDPLISELSKLDVDNAVLEAIMMHNYIGELTIEEFLIINHACHLQNVPIQNFLKDAVKKNELKKSKHTNSFYDGFSERSFSSKTNHCNTLPKTAANDTLADSEKSLKTPKNVRKCIQNIKELFSSLILSEISLENVIWMISQIEEISKENVAKYQERIKEINANGLVLATCNPEELKKELQMSFGDWHLFYTLIAYLKSIEEANESNFFQEVTEPTNKISPYNPLLLLEKKTSLLIDINGDNSNEIFSEESNSKLCDKCYISNKTAVNSDNDSVWKRKHCTHSSTLSKDNFLSPMSKSPVSSPKCLGNSLIQNTSTKPYQIVNTELPNFYSPRDNEVKHLLQNETFIHRTKPLPREDSFDSTTTFSTQLSSPRNSKCLYDMDSKSRTYTLPTDKSKKASIVKVKHNLGCQSYNHLQSKCYSENIDEISVDDIAVLVDAPSKFQTYLKKSDRPYHSSLFEISTSNLDRTLPQEKPFKKHYSESKKSSSQSNVHKQMSKRKHNTKHEDKPIFVKPIATNSIESHSRENMNIFSYYNTREIEPDIIFRTKYYSNGVEAITTKPNKKKKDDKSYHDKPCLKERTKKPSKHKPNRYNEGMNYEISHSEI